MSEPKYILETDDVEFRPANPDSKINNTVIRAGAVAAIVAVIIAPFLTFFARVILIGVAAVFLVRGGKTVNAPTPVEKGDRMYRMPKGDCSAVKGRVSSRF